jgi:hypothetical protein
LAAAVLLAFGSAHAADEPAAKIDNGLGELPPYREWKHHPELARFAGADRQAAVAVHRVPGEKLDSGLGALPDYSEWKNHPVLSRFVVDTASPVALNSR